ncbi:MAG: rhodanese-like domain-containing protein [Chitinophagia bacterium]|nr:rhodanese-like domain-containing protein [Chitinophagia bacterium]
MQNIIEQIKAKKGTLLDVRSTMEFEGEHIEGAINIPLDVVESRIKEIAQMPKPIVVYCLSGGRSGVATSILQQNGIKESYNGGGIFTLNNILNNN